jgi:predicted RNA-binding Zn-ribbon protein involved in translation (DUF1610 family)
MVVEKNGMANSCSNSFNTATTTIPFAPCSPPLSTAGDGSVGDGGDEDEELDEDELEDKNAMLYGATAPNQLTSMVHFHGSTSGGGGAPTGGIVKVYNGKKHFPCNICGKFFGKKNHVARHVAAVHKNIRPYVCETCGFPFQEKRGLIRHYKVHAKQVMAGPSGEPCSGSSSPAVAPQAQHQQQYYSRHHSALHGSQQGADGCGRQGVPYAGYLPQSVAVHQDVVSSGGPHGYSRHM